MKVPLSWIKLYLNIDLPVEKIAKTLTLAGLEVDSIELLGSDTVFEISLTPNLSHCMCVVGVARELAAFLNGKIQRHMIRFKEDPHVLIGSKIAVSIEDAESCHRYSCRLVQEVKVGPSPDWLKNELEKCGVRSVNNVVDIGNYVMLEFGQPLHMFDYDKIAGNKIRISSKVKGSLVTLDDIERAIPEGALMICDEKRPLAFAGIMGGKFSSVVETTERVLIEAAYFSPTSIRKTSKQLGLRTESVQRFERGIDPQGTLIALERAAELLEKAAGGSVAKGELDKIEKRYVPKVLDCRISRANKLLGTHLSIGEIASYFERLEIKVEAEKADRLTVSIPSYRQDLNHEIDLIEEIARLYGYQNLVPAAPPKHTSSTLTDAPLYLIEKEVREKLIAQELQEFLTCNLISPKLAKLTLEKAFPGLEEIPVLHPRSIDQSILRSSLLPSLLQIVQLNLAFFNKNISGFEVGRIHFKDKDKYVEQAAVGILLTGSASPHHFSSKSRPVDFYDLKGHVENLLETFGIDLPIFERSHLQNFHPGRQCRVKVKDIFIGALGEVHPRHLAELNIEERVYYAELNLHDLLSVKRKSIKMQPLPVYPGSERDWTVTIKDELPIDLISHAIRQVSSPYLEQIELLDLYKSEKIGKDRKNVTLRFFYRDKQKTMEFEEVEKEHARLLAEVAQKLRDHVH
ncbi:MAG TPA: phenylalanine--tRNA ligase subunit beta [Rhabdochlamydiaceae bacterium]|nr:phenylalanine--tRNA ligase subunit beta [Rhabdochlamydiaceae bacterium]